ncbi:MAG: terminase TerL endonuclease subunit, partial [Angelakisella sp.]
KAIFRVKNDPTTYVISMYWVLAEGLEERSKEDKARYDLWVEQGYMRAVEGNKIHPKYVTEWFLELQKKYRMNLLYIGYDAWSAQYWVEEMRDNFGKEAMIPVHQGKRTLSAPMKELGTDLDLKLVNYNNNPVDKWCLANTKKDEDKNGNIQPVKTSKRSKRIDGAASLLDCYVIMGEKQGEYLNMI